MLRNSNAVAASTASSKVFIIATRVKVAGRTSPAYIPVSDDAYTSIKEASKALRAAGGGRKGTNNKLVIYSFYPGGKPKDFTVTTTVKAKSQAEADAIIANALGR